MSSSKTATGDVSPSTIDLSDALAGLSSEQLRSLVFRLSGALSYYQHGVDSEQKRAAGRRLVLQLVAD